MSTGDLNCNVKRLRGVLRELRYTYASSLPEDRLREGDPSVLLPALHYCLLGYSSKVAAEVSRRGYELQAKTDERFVEHCWRFLREHFNLMPQLNKHQFLSKGFAERKLMLVTEVAKKCKELHSSLSRKAKLQTKRTPKGAHLESVFPPVAKRAAAHDGSNSGEVREVVVSHVDRDPESPIPVPKTPPRIIISGAGEAPADQERVQKEDSDIAEASSEALSSEYTSEDYEDEEDDGIITEEEDAGVQHPDEEEEEEAFHGFRQSPVDYVNHSPAGTLEQGTPRQRSSIRGGSTRPFSEVLMKEQVGQIVSKLESFQENVLAKFLLLEGRVRHLEAAMTKISTVEEQAKTVNVGHDAANPVNNSVRRVGTNPRQQGQDERELSAETTSFIAQVEGRCKQTQFLLDSLA